MSDLDLAYLAGIIDADGYVTATRSMRGDRLYFGAQVGITGSRRQPHDLAASIFGGNVNAILAVLPYLRVKHDRALLVVELQQDIDEARAFASEGGVPWLPVGRDRTAGFSIRVDEIRDLGRTWDEYPEASRDAGILT